MSGDLLQGLLLFAGSAVLVIISGVYLAKYGDALAGLMGWGRLWVGIVLVAGATSLPELATNITAATRDQPELVGGTLLGANMKNMFTLAMLALIFGRATFFRSLAPEQKYAVVAAIALTLLALVLGSFHLGVSVWSVGLASILVLALYLGGMRLVYVRRPPESTEPSGEAGPISLRKAWLLFIVASIGVIAAGSVLAFSAEQIADSTGLAASFLGVVAVAFVTTMPEVSTTVASVRMGAVDLGVGALYGSCAFNILVLALADPFYREGTLVETLGTEHMAAGLAAILLMTLGLSQILSRGRVAYAPVVPTLLLMAIIYAGGLYLVYSLG